MIDSDKFMQSFPSMPLLTGGCNYGLIYTRISPIKTAFLQVEIASFKIVYISPMLA